MADIGADYISIRNRLEELSGLYERLSLEVASVGKISENLDIFWDGDANDAYNLRFGEDLIDMGRILMSIRKTINCADGVLGLYMSNEKNVAQLIRGLYKGGN